MHFLVSMLEDLNFSALSAWVYVCVCECVYACLLSQLSQSPVGNTDGCNTHSSVFTYLFPGMDKFYLRDMVY
uniref:Putative secreted protein n=1 Tax=Anopheles darlingi TaxID=43151 RepID=A0A2M4D255_ANODA